MFGQTKESIKAKVTSGKKGEAMHKALTEKIDKKYVKQGLKEAHKRGKKEGIYKSEKF